MMASSREKRENTGEKLKDIIESLKGPKQQKLTLKPYMIAVKVMGNFKIRLNNKYQKMP
jgi:hypothetical protein